MFKLIFVIVAVLATEVVGGGDSICGTANQAAINRVQDFQPQIAAKRAQCLQTFQSTYDSYKAASKSKSQFNTDFSAVVNDCRGVIGNFVNQLATNLASDIGVEPAQLTAVVGGSGPFTPPISCVKDLFLSAYNDAVQADNDLVAKFNELAASY